MQFKSGVVLQEEDLAVFAYMLDSSKAAQEDTTTIPTTVFTKIPDGVD